MTASATVRVMTAEEIAASAGAEPPFLRFPARTTVFAEREMRLRQLARRHPMQDFLEFVAALVHEQQAQLTRADGWPIPDVGSFVEARAKGLAPLAPANWSRPPAWRDVLRSLAESIGDRAPAAAAPALTSLRSASDETLERLADAVLAGRVGQDDLAASPLVAAALQVVWTHALLIVHERDQASGTTSFGRIADRTVCPCCASLPTVSVTRSEAGVAGQRYLHCALCGLQWHLDRACCPHCLSGNRIAYESLAALDADEELESRAAKSAIQAETCDDCGHYLKILHGDRDPLVEPIADDLASFPLDLLLVDNGRERHGVNLMLQFAAADPPSGVPPP